ncbi:MAG: bifunctional diaminohydroxyphosphoribosylaminopyrimidine deaminase/5-amino-6-(5-phosphoribosylamino)uracil reductase RibD [Chitinophagaceae bacterium]|nr:bifunctional diaminohydroxyphosphoribosylaminopyrimidine deaminase/5-amino-6-(5-phosphoribosylamino)uracil reductase RibD [Chitinophagaceae bacterium]
MNRCLQLAALAAGNVAPNPMVGAVLVHEGRIIGEGYHKVYGQAHAEVNCIASVSKEDEYLISKSTMYVSLEPCAHYGKTAPCADLIIRHKIPTVVIGCRDPFTKVDGKGIDKLKAAGIEVIVNVLEKECKSLNRRFLTFYTIHRPYIILKWAQSNNGIIGDAGNHRLHISNAYTNRLVHKWRSEEAAILVGTNTARLDDPSLTTRLWPGKNSVRLVVDMELSLPHHLHLFDNAVTTIVFNSIQNTIESFENLNSDKNKTWYYQVTTGVNIVHQIIHALYHLHIQSVLVEGGAKLLQSFIDEGMWDEARVITNKNLMIAEGIKAPAPAAFHLTKTETLFSDQVVYYSNNQHLLL